MDEIVIKHISANIWLFVWSYLAAYWLLNRRGWFSQVRKRNCATYAEAAKFHSHRLSAERLHELK